MFDSLAKLAECAGHSDSADSLGLFGHLCTESSRSTDRCDAQSPRWFVVVETRNETTVDDLEDASLRLTAAPVSNNHVRLSVPRRLAGQLQDDGLFRSATCER